MVIFPLFCENSEMALLLMLYGTQIILGVLDNPLGRLADLADYGNGNLDLCQYPGADPGPMDYRRFHLNEIPRIDNFHK